MTDDAPPLVQYDRCPRPGCRSILIQGDLCPVPVKHYVPQMQKCPICGWSNESFMYFDARLGFYVSAEGGR